jgi:ABC-2 type transport system permease protein
LIIQELNAVFTIAFRDIIKLFRDRTRLAFLLIFPVIFIGIIGGMFQQNLGKNLNYNYQLFVFIGIIVQSLFSTSVNGLVSLVRDRETDFTQEMFVAPISRYSIIIGKIVGAGFISILSIVGIIIYGLILGLPINAIDLLVLTPVFLLACLLGGAFGMLIIGNVNNQQTVNLLFPFVMFPQMFVAGVITPVNNSGTLLSIISHIAPLTYIVDLSHGALASVRPEYKSLMLYSTYTNLIVISAMCLVFIVVGTIAFAIRERSK